jgi:hypothetical protein
VATPPATSVSTSPAAAVSAPLAARPAAARSRGHAVAGQVFADLIGERLPHLPSREFDANAACPQLAGTTHPPTGPSAPLPRPAGCAEPPSRAELIQVAGRPARISPWSLSASGSVPTALRDNLRIRASIGEWQQWRNYAIWPMKPVVVPTKGKSGSRLAVASYQKQICSRLVPVGSTAVNQDI